MIWVNCRITGAVEGKVQRGSLADDIHPVSLFTHPGVFAPGVAPAHARQAVQRQYRTVETGEREGECLAQGEVSTFVAVRAGYRVNRIFDKLFQDVIRIFQGIFCSAQQCAELCPQQLPAFPQQVSQFAEFRQIPQFSQQSRGRQKIAGYRYSPQDHSLPRRELRLDIQIGHLFTANKDVRRTFHDCRAALQFVALARGGLIVDKDVAAALGYPRWFVLLVAERRVLTGFREIYIFFDFATPAHHGGKLH